ncbi:MAG: hypothetical protein B6A08_03210 [Sorangiineae bacterium NIC37A_2]|jgi:hypothetical protein|nr:MAG: hypothetical protein B6A08_03210 [Sorangiineae bacterium NIC37A_2]
MTDTSRFPPGLLFREDGHVTDWVLSALVDGEEALLSAEATAHVDSCEECGARLGAMAHGVFALEAEVQEWAKAERARAPFPMVAFGMVGLGLVLGSVGFAVMRGDEWRELPHRALTLWRWAKALVPWLFERMPVLPMVAWGLSVLLIVAVGLAFVARELSKQERLS